MSPKFYSNLCFKTRVFLNLGKGSQPFVTQLLIPIISKFCRVIKKASSGKTIKLKLGGVSEKTSNAFVFADVALMAEP